MSILSRYLIVFTLSISFVFDAFATGPQDGNNAPVSDGSDVKIVMLEQLKVYFNPDANEVDQLVVTQGGYMNSTVLSSFTYQVNGTANRDILVSFNHDVNEDGYTYSNDEGVRLKTNWSDDEGIFNDKSKTVTLKYNSGIEKGSYAGRLDIMRVEADEDARPGLHTFHPEITAHYVL